MINKYSIFNDAKYFCLSQNYLVFKSANKYIKFLSRTEEIYSWKSKEVQKKVLRILLDQDTFAPNVINSYPLPDVKFGENCLINSNLFVFRNSFLVISLTH